MDDDETVRSVFIFLGPIAWFTVGSHVCQTWSRFLKQETRLKKEMTFPTLCRPRQVYNLREDHAKVFVGKIQEGVHMWFNLHLKMLLVDQKESCSIVVDRFKCFKITFPKGLRVRFGAGRSVASIVATKAGSMFVHFTTTLSSDPSCGCIYSIWTRTITEWPSERRWDLPAECPSTTNPRIFQVCQNVVLYSDSPDGKVWMWSLDEPHGVQEYKEDAIPTLFLWHDQVFGMNKDHVFRADQVNSTRETHWPGWAGATVYQNELYGVALTKGFKNRVLARWEVL